MQKGQQLFSEILRLDWKPWLSFQNIREESMGGRQEQTVAILRILKFDFLGGLRIEPVTKILSQKFAKHT